MQEILTDDEYMTGPLEVEDFICCNELDIDLKKIVLDTLYACYQVKKEAERADVYKRQERNYSKDELEIFWKQCRSIVKKENCANEEGNPFEFTGRMMKSALYSNIVYPIRRHGEYICLLYTSRKSCGPGGCHVCRENRGTWNNRGHFL